MDYKDQLNNNLYISHPIFKLSLSAPRLRSPQTIAGDTPLVDPRSGALKSGPKLCAKSKCYFLTGPKRIIFYILAALLFCPLAKAVLLSEETDYGSLELIESASVSGEFIGQPAAKTDKAADDLDDDSPFGWDMSYSYQRTDTPTPGSPDIIDNTYNYGIGANWYGNSEYGISGKIAYSFTPDENLTSYGGEASGEYRWLYLKTKIDGFSPYLNFKVEASSTDYSETYEGAIPRKKAAPKRVSGTSELWQRMVGLALSWKPYKPWKFSFEFDQFFYNRDVSTFQNQLDSPTALQTGMNAFGSTVGGVATVSYNLGVAWYFSESWHLNTSAQISRLAADESLSSTYKATLTAKCSKSLNITVGAEREISDVLTDTLAILGVDYDL